MNLYVLRHGQTNINVKNKINGWNIWGLNRVGKEEARKASEKVKRIPLDLIVCSPLRRARQTCKIVNVNNVKVIIDKRVIERDTGTKQYTSCKSEDIDVNIWYDITKEKIFKNTEGFKSMVERAIDVLQELKQQFPGKDKNVLIVTHGDFARAIMVALTNERDKERIWKFDQGNCEIVKYEM